MIEMGHYRLFVGFMLAAALFAPMVHFDNESNEFNFFSEDFSQLDQR